MNPEEVISILKDALGNKNKVYLGEGSNDVTKSIWFEKGPFSVFVDHQIRVYDAGVRGHCTIFTDIFDFQDWVIANMV
ncbi:hypothetical protein RsoM2USA_293 [Ralstonia phage RsoM2USA]|nr:hypothetical protein RsoM2USA_293 [Ralstonia phage RsoM2USA]